MFFLTRIIRETIRSCGRICNRAPKASHEARKYPIAGDSNFSTAAPRSTQPSFEEKKSNDAIAARIEWLVTSGDMLELAWLDREIRDCSEYRLPPIRPANVRHLWGGSIGALGMFSFHRNGFVREAAIEILSELQGGQELPFLLLRLNDWVDPVRELAKQAVVERIRTEYAAHFIQCLPLVYALKGKGRADHTLLLDSIVGMLCHGEARLAVHRAIGGWNRIVRHAAFRLLMDHPEGDATHVLENALRSDDVVLRLWATRLLRTHLTGQSLRTMLERLFTDRFMPVRREALCGFAELFPDDAQRYHQAALLDPHKSVRETARFYLAKSGWTDFTSFYSSCLADSDENKLATAISGLGEVGSASHAPVVAGFLTHPNPRVRRAAVRAIGHLDPDSFKDHFFAALANDSALVSNTAFRVLGTHHHLLTSRRLWLIFTQACSWRVRQRALSLIRKLSWWDSAALLVSATGSKDEDSRMKAIAYLKQWQTDHGRLTVRPADEQWKRLREAVDRNRLWLDAAVKNDLEDHLRFWATR